MFKPAPKRLIPRSRAPLRPLTVAAWAVLWTAIAATTLLVWSTHQSLSRLENELPFDVLKQSSDISALVADTAVLVGNLERAAGQVGEVDRAPLVQHLETLVERLTELRHSSDFTIPIGASAVHAVLYPAALDARLWLTEGVPGLAEDDGSTLTVVSNRLLDSYGRAARLAAIVRDNALELVGRQAQLLEEFRASMVLYLLALCAFAGAVIVLVIRRNTTESRLSTMRHRLVDSIETVSEGFVLFDRDDRLLLCNTRYRQLFPAELQDHLYMMPYREIAYSLILSDSHSVSGYFFRERLDAFLKWHAKPDGFFEIEHASGLVFQVNEHVTPNGDTVGIFHDVTALTEARRHMEHIARHDRITGLLTRAYFEDLVRRSLADARRKGHLAALFFIDLDRFKIINDSFGHPSGDLVLNHIARQLKRYASPRNLFARYGGDEFALFVGGMDAGENVPANCMALAGNILRDVSGSVNIGSAEVFITASIGIALYPAHGNALKNLVVGADTAAYYAKSLGGDNVQMFSEELKLVANRKVELERYMRLGLNRDEFSIAFQPKIDLANGTINGLEALARWDSETLGEVSPLEFIPLAEETGLIFALGNHVLAQVCGHLSAWRRAGLATVPVSINLSARQFRDKNLFERISGALIEADIPAEQVIIEITETTALDNIDNAVETLNRLNGIGVRLAIDDFGTDYSSMSAIRRFPVDLIKIDYSFVQDMEHDATSLEIITAIITMAHNMGIRVVAEGVENERQLALLRARRCDAVQGFYFSQAVHADEVPGLLRDRLPRRAPASTPGA